MRGRKENERTVNLLQGSVKDSVGERGSNSTIFSESSTEMLELTDPRLMLAASFTLLEAAAAQALARP